MATPYFRLTTTQFKALMASGIGTLKPYQIDQVKEYISKLKFEHGSNVDVSVQETLQTIANRMTSEA